MGNVQIFAYATGKNLTFTMASGEDDEIGNRLVFRNGMIESVSTPPSFLALAVACAWR